MKIMGAAITILATSLATQSAKAQSSEDVQSMQRSIVSLANDPELSQFFDDEYYVASTKNILVSPLPARITRIFRRVQGGTGESIIQEAIGSEVEIEKWLHLADSTYCAIRYHIAPEDFELNISSIEKLLDSVTKDTALTAQEKMEYSSSLTEELEELTTCLSDGARLSVLLSPLEDEEQ